MSKVKKIAVMLVGLFLVLFIAGFIMGSVVNLIVPPSQAMASDEFSVDIGADNTLVATFHGCLKVGEENIPSGNFKTSYGQEFSWNNAKNVSYVNDRGNKGYAIVWKDSPENYKSISGNNGVSYISDYLTSMNGRCFLVHYPEKNAVYGIIVCTDDIVCTESDLMYDILGLDSSQFTPTYTSQSYGSTSSYGSGGHSHYHTVVSDPYSLARNDPDSYYDHYEYGDNYDIDDYLESEGYD